MKKIFKILSLFCILTMISCSGVPQQEINTKLATTAPEGGKSRILIYRDKDTSYMGVSARIDINGQRAAELWRGEVYAANMAPGKISIAVDAWSAPGHYTVDFDALPDTTYTFEIEPRLVAANILTAGAYSFADFTVNENSGAFSIDLKDTVKNHY